MRYVGNRSTGSLAVHLAEEACQRGHQVRLLLADYVPAPVPHERLVVDRFSTAETLQRQLTEPESGPDLLIHAAAVADYAPEPMSGKVSSGQDVWSLTLRPLPKIADQFRARFPNASLLMFKLETDIGQDELRQRALQTAQRAGAQWIFGNLLESSGSAHAGWLWETASGEATSLSGGKAAVARGLLEAVEQTWASGAS